VCLPNGCEIELCVAWEESNLHGYTPVLGYVNEKTQFQPEINKALKLNVNI